MRFWQPSFHLVTARTTSFYYSFVFLPREKRRAIEAVYAFARRGDDVVDGGLAPEVARRELDRYRQALDRCYSAAEGGPDGDGDGDGKMRELQALATGVRRYKLPRRLFEDLILGFEMDLVGHRYQTFDDLALYCYRVASTIGLISVEIFGYQDPRARDYAVNLGIALQLVNILRDLRSDALSGRVYLPSEDLERFGVRAADLAAGQYSEAFVELMQFECDRARHYFSLARQMLPSEDRRSLIAAEIMGAIYWRLLGRIRQKRYNVLAGRVRLRAGGKLWTAVSVYLGGEWHS